MGLPEDGDWPRTNLWLMCRKSFQLDEAPATARARIAVDSKYWLWVNGQLVVREGGLKRGPTPRDTYYDEVDLEGRLRPGSNTLAVLVWYFGKHGFSHNSSGQPGLLFEGEWESDPALSDRTWKLAVHPAFGNTDAPHPNYRLPESNIRYDARNEPGDWTTADYDDSAWTKASEFGVPPAAPWNRLVKRPIPFWRDYGLRPYVNSNAAPSISTGQPIRMRLPHNAHVNPYFAIDAPAGRRVDIRTDNYRGGSAPNVRAEYITREGVQSFECPGWMNGHEVHYRFPRDVRILALGYRETGYDADFAGSFQSNDRVLNQLWREAARTLYVTMRDTYMDCPDRERALWWGDTVIELGEAFYALDPRSHELARKNILELMNWQRPDGTLFSPVPAGNWDKELPMQMLASVGWYGFWTYYLHSGDEGILHRVYPGVKTYMDLWQLGEDGLVVPRRGGWTWGDWGEHKDLRILYNGWFQLALKGQLAMAKQTGHTNDLPAIQGRMDSIRRNFNRIFWTGTAYRSPDYSGLTDDRGHALAVLAGLALTNQYPAIREVFRTHHHASPYMEKYVLEALIRMGNVDDALNRMKTRYRAMLEDDLTTLYEGWGVGAAGYGGGTYNHAWSGGPLTVLSELVAGITPLKPGYAEFEVRPGLGPLTNVSTTVPSVRGPIRLTARTSANGTHLDLESPPEAKAVVVLPLKGATELRVNGAPVWHPDETGTQPEHVRLLPDPARASLRVEVDPGHWRFELDQPAESQVKTPSD